MFIESAELFRVPLASPAAMGSVDRESIFVALGGQGQIGWGEVSLARSPVESAEWSAGAMACLRDWLAPAVVSRDLPQADDLQSALHPFQGHSGAKSALDIAWWNLSAALQKKPLAQLLGGNQGRVPVQQTLGVMNSTDALLAAIGAALARGYKTVVLPFRPGWDLEMLRAVRQVFASEPLAIDCGGLCTLGQQETFYRIEDFCLKFIEQPLPADDLVGHAMLQDSLRTPICLSHSITSVQRAEQAVDLGSCRQLVIDPARVGGLTPARTILREICQPANVAVTVGGGPQHAVAATAGVALACLGGMPVSQEAIDWRTEPWLAADSAAWLHVCANGNRVIELPEGFISADLAIDRGRLAAQAIEQHTIH